MDNCYCWSLVRAVLKIHWNYLINSSSLSCSNRLVLLSLDNPVARVIEGWLVFGWRVIGVELKSDWCMYDWSMFDLGVTIFCPAMASIWPDTAKSNNPQHHQSQRLTAISLHHNLAPATRPTLHLDDPTKIYCCFTVLCIFARFLSHFRLFSDGGLNVNCCNPDWQRGRDGRQTKKPALNSSAGLTWISKCHRAPH